MIKEEVMNLEEKEGRLVGVGREKTRRNYIAIFSLNNFLKTEKCFNQNLGDSQWKRHMIPGILGTFPLVCISVIT